MEKLHIACEKRCISVRRAGNEVLLISYPTITGETPAAVHTAALVEALVQHAREQAADRAAAALSAAVQQGRLFAFSRHKFDISLAREAKQNGLSLVLSIAHTTGNETPSMRKLTMYWDQAEQLQYRHLPRARHTDRSFRQSAARKAKKRI